MSRRYSRRAEKRAPREAVAIFTEGQVTEVEYLERVRAELGIPKELVSIHPSDHTDPKGLVEEAVDAKRENECDAVRGGGRIANWWVLVDTERGRDGLAEAIQNAKANGIWLGLSDPYVEFWLLLHFCYTTAQFDGPSEAVRRLGKWLPSYNGKHKHPDMDVLLPLLPDAMANAALVRANYTLQGFSSPCTDWDLLMNDLNAQAKAGSELFERKTPSKEDLAMYHVAFK